MENEPMHILLADDDEADRLLFMDAFSALKMKTVVETVNNGVELMEWLNTEDNHLPHLLFLDLNMPLKDGLQCLKEIRSNEALKNISVAIYSTSDADKDVEDTFLNGANIYIAKPNDFDVLKELLSRAVSAAHLYEGNQFNKDNFMLRV